MSNVEGRWEVGRYLDPMKILSWDKKRKTDLCEGTMGFIYG